MDDQYSKLNDKKKLNFLDFLPKIMFSFGDEKFQNQKTTELLEKYLINLIDKIVLESYDRANRRGINSKILKDDILFTIKNKKKWMSRISYLINKKKELNKLMKETKENNINN